MSSKLTGRKVQEILVQRTQVQQCPVLQRQGQLGECPSSWGRRHLEELWKKMQSNSVVKQVYTCMYFYCC